MYFFFLKQTSSGFPDLPDLSEPIIYHYFVEQHMHILASNPEYPLTKQPLIVTSAPCLRDQVTPGKIHKHILLNCKKFENSRKNPLKNITSMKNVFDNNECKTIPNFLHEVQLFKKI